MITSFSSSIAGVAVADGCGRFEPPISVGGRLDVFDCSAEYGSFEMTGGFGVDATRGLVVVLVCPKAAPNNTPAVNISAIILFIDANSPYSNMLWGKRHL